MHKNHSFGHKKSAFLLLFLLQFVIVSAATYYVSVTGTSTATGTKLQPLNFTTAIAKSLLAGDSVIVRGGFYNYNSSQTISRSGTATAYIHIVAYADEVPVIDFRTQAYSSSNIGVKVSGNYLHIKGLTIQGAGDNGMQVTGSNDFIEFCSFRWNCDSGLQLKTGSNNLIMNCDSYENFDYQSGGTASPDYGGNADGFADKQYTNTGTNTFKGCRSWLNSDDGWDHFEKIGNTVIDSCWCYANGPASFDMTNNIRFKTDSATWFSKFKNASGNYVVPNYGNGNGFKLGGNYTANNAIVRNCVAVSNTVKGFDQNNNNGTMTIYNCTGYKNQYNYGFSNSSYGSLMIKNCASLSSTKANTLSTKTVTQSNNSWSAGLSCLSTDFLSLEVEQMLNPRQSNGALPEITLLHQTASSSMIDKGITLGLSFSGTSPDLGAFEYKIKTAIDGLLSGNEKLYYSETNKAIVVKGEIKNIRIYTTAGQQVNTIRSPNLGTISTSGWKQGIYVVSYQTTDHENLFTKVLVK